MQKLRIGGVRRHADRDSGAALQRLARSASGRTSGLEHPLWAAVVAGIPVADDHRLRPRRLRPPPGGAPLARDRAGGGRRVPLRLRRGVGRRCSSWSGSPRSADSCHPRSSSVWTWPGRRLMPTPASWRASPRDRRSAAGCWSLATDPRWGTAASPVLNAIAIELAQAVSRWSAALLTLQDEEMFAAIDRFGLVGTDISDLAARPLTRVAASTHAECHRSRRGLADALPTDFVREGEYWRRAVPRGRGGAGHSPDAIGWIAFCRWHCPPLEIRPRAGARSDRGRCGQRSSECWESGVTSGSQWTVAGYAQLADLNQPPYGETGRGAAKRRRAWSAWSGWSPCLAPFGLIPGLGDGSDPHRFRPEVGLYWATAPAERGQGYATEAAAALIAFGFDHLQPGPDRGHHRARQPGLDQRHAKARDADRGQSRPQAGVAAGGGCGTFRRGCIDLTCSLMQT